MAERKDQSTRLDALEERIEELEDRLRGATADYTTGKFDTVETPQVCSIPPASAPSFDPGISPARARAILSVGRKWVNGTHLHYYLFDSGPWGGDSSQQDVVREAFGVWKSVGIGLEFTEVRSIDDAEIRVGFLRGDGSWSTIGTDALRRGQQERTMNFGWRINVSGPNGLDTATHEIGHALGFNHEHQNPNAGIVWNEQAVYDYFARTQSPPWDHATTDFNILDKIDPATVGGTDWDPNSIMHYAFAAGLIREPARYRSGLSPAPGLSEKDIEVVRRFYPDNGGGSVVHELKPMRSELLSLAPGEQKEFNVLPAASRNYDFSTFGQSDTVMVLFEETGGGFTYVKGDDDSGFDRNARFRVRLVKGRKYRLRIRLYYSSASGDTAVLMW